MMNKLMSKLEVFSKVNQPLALELTMKMEAFILAHGGLM